MAKTPVNEILPDIVNYKQFKEKSHELKRAKEAKGASVAKGIQKSKEAKEKGREYKASKANVKRKEIAKLAGLSDEQVKRLQFVDRYAPDLLARAKGDEKVSEIYYPVWSWYQTLKKHDSDLFKKVIEGKIKLKTAYDKLLKQKPSIKPVAKESPIAVALKGGRDIIEKWIREQHEGKLKPTSAERKLIQDIDALLSKYTNK